MQAPHPIITRARLLELLDPKPDDRVLELGPGTGYYTLAVAQELRQGRLTMVDIQQDPHMVTFSALRTRADRVGFRIERRIGSFLGYFALLRRNSV